MQSLIQWKMSDGEDYNIHVKLKTYKPVLQGYMLLDVSTVHIYVSW